MALDGEQSHPWWVVERPASGLGRGGARVDEVADDDGHPWVGDPLVGDPLAGDPLVEDGVGVFVAVATGTRSPRDLLPDGDLSGAAGPGAHRWETRIGLDAWRGLRQPVRIAVGAVAVGLLLLVGVVVAGGGGPAVDPALPVAAADTPGPGGSEPPASPTASDPLAPPGGDPSARVDGDTAMLVVHVAGAVLTPGVHRLPAGARVHEAIEAAGGPLPGADLDRLNLAAPLTDGTQVFVPLPAASPGVPGVGAPAGSVGAGAGGGSGTGAGGGGSAPGPVSLNSADAAALDALPGIGPSTASAIIAHREANGPFGSVEDLLEVRGIGEAKLDGLRDLVVP